MKDTAHAFRIALAADPIAFLERAFCELDPQGKLLAADYIFYLNNVLRAVAGSEVTRVIINLPPRHLKSILISVVWPAWLLGNSPEMRIAVISHSQSLARDLGLKTLRLMETEFYRNVFPKTRLRDDRRQATDFETLENGGRYAASFETGVTGRGFNLIIVDDPISAYAARSAAERDRVNETFDTMIASRLDNQVQGAIVVVQQRLHENDLSGHLLNKGGWMHVSIPLIAEEATSLQIGNYLWLRKPGGLLLPSLWPQEVVARVRADMGEAAFSAQYQQNPSASIGELIKPSDIQKFDELPVAANRRILSWDTAVKTGSNSSYSVGLVFATDGKRHYVIDVLRARLDPVQARDAALELIARYTPQAVLIEDASAGPGLAAMLEERGYRCELRPTRGLSKEERLEPYLHMFCEGRVLIKNREPWTTELVNEWSRFPFGKHDDQVDAMSQYLAWAAEKLSTKKLTVVGAGVGWEEKLARTLIYRPQPSRKGEHPFRPARRGLGRWRLT